VQCIDLHTPLIAVFGGFEDETESDRQEAINSQGRKKQQPQVCIDCLVPVGVRIADVQSSGGNLW